MKFVVNILFVITMFIILAVAAGVDRWLNFLRLQARATLTVTPITGAATLAALGTLIILGLCLALFWVIARRNETNWLLFALFTIIGSVIIFYNPVALSSPSLNMITALQPDRLVFTAGAFFAAAGFFNLLLALARWLRRNER